MVFSPFPLCCAMLCCVPLFCICPQTVCTIHRNPVHSKLCTTNNNSTSVYFVNTLRFADDNVKSIVYLTNSLQFSVRVYCNRSQITSQLAKNKKSACCSSHAVTSYGKTRTEKRSLFVLYNKNSNGLLKYFGGHEQTKNRSADVICRGFDAICVCVSFNISRSPTNENAHRSHVIV